MKRIISIILALSVATGSLLFSACDRNPVQAEGMCNIKAAVLGNDENIYNELKYSIMANLDAVMLEGDDDYTAYDIIYLTEGSQFDAEKISDYVYGGGTVVLHNSHIQAFDNAFLGAAEIAPLTAMPVDLTYSYTENNLRNISELLYDYTSTLKQYADFGDYLGYNYGLGIIPSTAEVIAGVGDVGVYTVNSFGAGDVFITNPMLPSDYSVNAFKEGESGEPLAFTSVAAQTLLMSYYAEYVSFKKYGFAIERSFGSFASNPAAWELHYEDISGIENKSLMDFASYCMENNQMPSFTLVRNPYKWFKRAESVSYLEYDNGFTHDSYEGAYCSGEHIVSGDKWLELDSYENTDSYFDDNPMYTKRAYPYPIDWNDDGKMDLICGSADGLIYYYEGRDDSGDNYEMSIGMNFTDESGNALSVGAYSSPSVFDINGDGRGEIISGSEDGVIRAYKSLKNEDNPKSMAFTFLRDVINTGMPDSMIATGFLNDDNIMDIAVGSRTGEMRVYYGYTIDGRNTLYGDYIPVETNESWVSPCIYDGKLYSGTAQGFVACYEFDGVVYKKTDYLRTHENSRRGDDRITIGMNSVPRFYDIDGDGDDDLLCGSLEYGMAYPIDSEYFPYKSELETQLGFCEDNGIYVGVHGMTHRYASPEQEMRELSYHKTAFDTLGLKWDGVGINQHTWYTSNFGYDGSGINGYNPDYNGTFKAQSESGLLWNSGSTLPESSVVPQNCAENAIPMPMYMEELDFMVFETSNTPHGDGAHSYTSVKYEMPLLFYNHCDYMYDDRDGQKLMSDKVGELVDEYDYMFVREDQLAKSVFASYNSDIKADMKDGEITVSKTDRDVSKRLYDEKFASCVGVKIIFGDGVSASEYITDASVNKAKDNTLYIGLDKTVTVRKGNKNGLNIKDVNIPADVKLNKNNATVEFKDGGMMSVRVKGEAKTSSKGWWTIRDGEDTVFVKFGKDGKIKIKAN